MRANTQRRELTPGPGAAGRREAPQIVEIQVVRRIGPVHTAADKHSERALRRVDCRMQQRAAGIGEQGQDGNDDTRTGTHLRCWPSRTGRSTRGRPGSFRPLRRRRCRTNRPRSCPACRPAKAEKDQPPPRHFAQQEGSHGSRRRPQQHKLERQATQAIGVQACAIHTIHVQSALLGLKRKISA